MNYINTLADASSEALSSAAVSLGSFFFVWMFIFVLIYALAGWMLFEKAGYQGWKALIPFYNTYTLVKIANRPRWWFILIIIPYIEVFVRLIVSLDIARAFGKGKMYGIFFLWLLPFVGLLFIGWNKSIKYKFPNHNDPFVLGRDQDW